MENEQNFHFHQSTTLTHTHSHGERKECVESENVWGTEKK